MTLQTIISEKLAERDIADIAKLAGYQSIDKMSSRIEKILKSPYLSLDKSTYDFNSSTREFIRKLCAALNIPALLYDNIIDEILEELHFQEMKFKPYIFIETNFKRDTQPIFVLAFTQGWRYITLDSEAAKLPLNAQVGHVQTLVKNHYLQHPKITIWGAVEQYVYYYSNSIIIILSPTGEILDTVEKYSHSIASISIK